MTQTPAQIRRFLTEGEYRINAEPAEKENPCTHEDGWKRYKYTRGHQFYRCRWCGEISD